MVGVQPLATPRRFSVTAHGVRLIRLLRYEQPKPEGYLISITYSYVISL